MATTLDKAIVQWNTELASEGGLAKASLYQLQQCKQALWNAIMSQGDTAREEILRAYQHIRAELKLRTL